MRLDVAVVAAYGRILPARRAVRPAARLRERACLAPPALARRGPHPVGHRRGGRRDRRLPDADGGGAGHRAGPRRAARRPSSRRTPRRPCTRACPSSAAPCSVRSCRASSPARCTPCPSPRRASPSPGWWRRRTGGSTGPAPRWSSSGGCGPSCPGPGHGPSSETSSSRCGGPRWWPARGPPGTVLAAQARLWRWPAARGRCALLEVQPEGKRRMTAAEFLSGHRLAGRRASVRRRRAMNVLVLHGPTLAVPRPPARETRRGSPWPRWTGASRRRRGRWGTCCGRCRATTRARWWMRSGSSASGPRAWC